MSRNDKPAKRGVVHTMKSYRGRHRSKSDEAAHDNDKPFMPPPIIEHPQVCSNEPILVDTQDKLVKAIEHLRSAGTFGYDTEFIGEDSYYPHLCVIQAATTEQVILLDPLALKDLSPWWALLSDNSLCKIVHAGTQDIEPVHRLTDKPATNIFDTQVVAGLVGLDYPLSLGNTIQAILGVEHDAGAKFSKWDRRPLSPQQIHYAAGDVRYLCAMHAWMLEKLNELGNTDLAEQACAELCEPKRYASDPLGRKVKAKGVNKLSRKKRAAFNGLLICARNLHDNTTSHRADYSPTKPFMKSRKACQESPTLLVLSSSCRAPLPNSTGRPLSRFLKPRSMGRTHLNPSRPNTVGILRDKRSMNSGTKSPTTVSHGLSPHRPLPASANSARSLAPPWMASRSHNCLLIQVGGSNCWANSLQMKR